MVNIGILVTTDGVDSSMAQDVLFEKFVGEVFTRYMNEDWGEMEKSDIDANNKALISGDRILASYSIPEHLKKFARDRHNSPCDKIWIITEADRSVTTILFPSEY